MRRTLRGAALDVAVIAAAFVVGASLLAPRALYGSWLDRGPTRSLDRPCAGVPPDTVATLVPAARRSVDTVPDGWSWTCRWRSGDAASLRTVNPTLTATASRWGKWGSASPRETATKEYAATAARQVAEVRFGGDDAEARAAGLGVFVLPHLGDRAQLYVGHGPGWESGHEVRVVALRGNVVVDVRLVAYRTSVRQLRDVAVRTAGGVVGTL